MITEDYVSFETAKLLKEKEFVENCLTRYNKVGDLVEEVYKFNWNFQTIDYSAPTLQMAMKWLRRIYNINIDIVSIWNQKRFEYQVFVVTPENTKHCYVDSIYLGYEEATESAIKYCLENLI